MKKRNERIDDVKKKEEAVSTKKTIIDATGKKRIKSFIDEYCALVVKHKMQFGFGFSDKYECSDGRQIIFSDVVIAPFDGNLAIGQAYPNKELAHVVGTLESGIIYSNSTTSCCEGRL